MPSVANDPSPPSPQLSHHHQAINDQQHRYNRNIPPGSQRTGPALNGSSDLIPSPATPPLTPRANGRINEGAVGMVSAVPAQGPASKKKKKPRQRHPHKDDRIMTSPIASARSITPPLIRAASSGQPNHPTFGKSTTTPSRAYAGPTFHASPAPSALPIPSFISKSVPDVAAKNSLQARMEDSSDASDASPPRFLSASTDEPIPREESPLDIFFKAHRQEKANARGNDSPELLKLSQNLISETPDHESVASPFDGENRCHSRNTNGNFAKDMLSMDLDSGTLPNKPSKPILATHYKDRMNAVRSYTAPSTMTTIHDEAEAERKAKTQALKNLLLTPQPQRPASSSPHYNGAAHQYRASQASPISSAARSGCKQPDPAGSGVQTFSGSNFANGLEWSPQREQIPSLHESLLATANGSPRPMVRSSNLRQEISHSGTPEVVQQSDFRGEKFAPSTLSNYDVGSQNNSRPSELSQVQGSRAVDPISPSHTIKSAGTKACTTDIKAMEDDLRRILKMDILNNATSSAS
ncbi:MAG: hypothetical protein M1827_003545 [Pycnora praestabilis]|nr:MAG: hypothetical protein M1827_003545 [Pycnora praestabilis]